MTAKLKLSVRRWREQYRLRRAAKRDAAITARETLRDFKRYTGDEPGPPMGGGW